MYNISLASHVSTILCVYDLRRKFIIMRKSNFKELDTNERRSVQREKIKIYIYVINHIREREEFRNAREMYQ